MKIINWILLNNKSIRLLFTMTTIPGDDAKSAAPVSVVEGSQSQQELSNATTLTTSTDGDPESTGRLMKDVDARLSLPQPSPTSRDEAVPAIMRKEAAGASTGDKSTKPDVLDKGLESGDDGDKTPLGETASAELSPGKDDKSHEKEQSSRSSRSSFEAPIVFNDTEFRSLSDAAKRLNDPAYTSREGMVDYMKVRLDNRPSIITAKTDARVLKQQAIPSYKFRIKQHGDSKLNQLQNIAGKEHINVHSTVDRFVNAFPDKLTSHLKTFGMSGGVNFLTELYQDSDVGVGRIANDLINQDQHFLDKYIGSCSALSALQEIDNAKGHQYMDLPHPMYLICLPNEHVRHANGNISSYRYKMLQNPYSMHLPRLPYQDFVNTFCTEHEYLPRWKTIEHRASNYRRILYWVISTNPSSVISIKDISKFGITATNSQIEFQLSCDTGYPAVYKHFLTMLRKVHEFTYVLMRGRSERDLINDKSGPPNIWISISKPTIDELGTFYNYDRGLFDHPDDDLKKLAGKTHTDYQEESREKFLEYLWTVPESKPVVGPFADLYTHVIDCLEYQTELTSRKFAKELATCEEAFVIAKQGGFPSMSVERFEQVFYDLHLTNEELKRDLYESPLYTYLKLKANGDKEALAPWEDPPPPKVPKVKAPRKPKSASRKKRKSDADGADNSTATQPSLDGIIEQLTRMKSGGTDLSRLAILLSEQPTAGDSNE